MSWYDTLTSTPALVAGALVTTAVLYANRPTAPAPAPAPAGAAPSQSKLKPAPAKTSIMSAPATDLQPPKSDPISPTALSAFDGSDPTKPIYVAIKGNVYDVSAKKDMYGAGSGYNVFAGKDASRGLGMSSLDPKDAVPDYSTLDEAQMKTLNHWEQFFQKRYNIVGKVAP